MPVGERRLAALQDKMQADIIIQRIFGLQHRIRATEILLASLKQDLILSEARHAGLVYNQPNARELSLRAVGVFLPEEII